MIRCGTDEEVSSRAKAVLALVSRAGHCSDDVDEAERLGAVPLGRAENGEIGPVVDAPGIRLLPGDAQR